jgi:hypothetical protein
MLVNDNEVNESLPDSSRLLQRLNSFRSATKSYASGMLNRGSSTEARVGFLHARIQAEQTVFLAEIAIQLAIYNERQEKK